MGFRSIIIAVMMVAKPPAVRPPTRSGFVAMTRMAARAEEAMSCTRGEPTAWIFTTFIVVSLIAPLLFAKRSFSTS